MIKKHYYRGGKTCRVWFYLPAEVNAREANIVGDFNGWDQRVNPMKVKKDGTFYLGLSLEAGKDYQFRYLLDHERWENDWQADAYVPNDLGEENSVVKV